MVHYLHFKNWEIPNDWKECIIYLSDTFPYNFIGHVSMISKADTGHTRGLGEEKS